MNTAARMCVDSPEERRSMLRTSNSA